MSDRCSWCGVELGDDAGFRAMGAVADSQRGRAAFCRLEHIVPWLMQDPRWESAPVGDGDEETALGVCAQCGDALGDGWLLLVRHRGTHRIADAFCGAEHLLAWAKRGGRWRTGV